MTAKATATKATAAAGAAPALAELREKAAAGAAAARAALDELRSPIHQLQLNLARARHGVCSRAEVEHRARYVVAELAKTAGRGVAALADQDDAAPVIPINGTIRHLSDRPAVALWAALAPDRLLEWLLAELDKHAAACGGWAKVDFQERQAARKRQTDELLDLERREEELIVAFENEGVRLPRRPDADPRAVLGLDK